MNDRLIPFLRKSLLTSRREGVCRELVLHHASLGSRKGAKVQSWEISQADCKPEAIEEMANEIRAAASSDASALTGMQSYVVKAYFGDNEDSSARCAMRVDGDTSADDDDEGGFASEPPTGKGIITQLMRHNQAIMKTSAYSTAAIMQSMTRQVQKMSERMEAMETERIANITTFESLMTQRHERELEARKVTIREEGMKEMLATLKGILPIVATKFLKAPDGGVKSEAASMTGAALKTFFESLSDEQKAVIFQTLNDEQRAVLMEVYQAAAT